MEQENKKQESEKLKMGMIERWKVRRTIKKIRKLTLEFNKKSKKLIKRYEKLSDKEKKELQDAKEQMIISIVGDNEGKVIGLRSIFEIENEDGTEVTRKSLEKEKVEDIANLIDDLLNALEKEV